jgi:hypothetical protein
MRWDEQRDLLLTMGAQRCRHLQPYAVRFRYDDIPVGSSSALDRSQVQRDVEAVRLWVKGIIGTP